jgi:hypothetical protein
MSQGDDWEDSSFDLGRQALVPIHCCERVLFNKRGRYGELEHPIKRELWSTLEQGVYDQSKLEHGATVPRAIRHATVVTTLLWSLVQEGESKVGC